MNGTAIRVKVEVFTDRQLAAVIAGGQQPATRMAQIEQARRAYADHLDQEEQALAEFEAELRNERYFEEGF